MKKSKEKLIQIKVSRLKAFVIVVLGSAVGNAILIYTLWWAIWG